MSLHLGLTTDHQTLKANARPLSLPLGRPGLPRGRRTGLGEALLVEDMPSQACSAVHHQLTDFGGAFSQPHLPNVEDEGVEQMIKMQILGLGKTFCPASIFWSTHCT